jgi:hypothetical protein
MIDSTRRSAVAKTPNQASAQLPSDSMQKGPETRQKRTENRRGIMAILNRRKTKPIAKPLFPERMSETKPSLPERTPNGKELSPLLKHTTVLSPPPFSLDLGTAPYTILKKIGERSTSSVYEGYHVQTYQPVCIILV